jgi:hypothetical protein
MYVIGEVGAGQPATIEVARLDDLVDGPIDLVKLDVEGHEPAALRGMAGLIAAHAPLIVTEANEYWLRTCSGTRTAAYAEMLIELGYRLYDVERPGAPVEDDLSHVDALSVRNWLAVPTAGVRPAMATA